MSWEDLGKLAVASVPVAALGIALFNAWLAARADRRRNQPVVICHSNGGGLRFAAGTGFETLVTVENAGGGPAFDVRFGVALGGFWFPYRGDANTTGPPHRFRVIPPGATKPDPDPDNLYRRPVAQIRVDAAVLLTAVREGSKELEGSAVYWAWFKNSYGQTWEVLNPTAATSDLAIKRVRFPRTRERHRSRQLMRAEGHVRKPQQRETEPESQPS